MKVQHTNVQPQPAPDPRTNLTEARDVNTSNRVVNRDGNRVANRDGRVGKSEQPDEVSLSSFSRQIRLQQPGSEERESRIEALSALVDRGAYHVDSQQLSRSLIADAEHAEL